MPWVFYTVVLFSVVHSEQVGLLLGVEWPGDEAVWEYHFFCDGILEGVWRDVSCFYYLVLSTLGTLGWVVIRGP